MNRTRKGCIAHGTYARRGRALWLAFLAAILTASAAQAVSYVDLIAYVTYSLLDNQGSPLPDGSIVMIIGSGDDANDGMVPWGDSYIADSVQGDDVFIGQVTIGNPSYGNSNGTFYTANQFELDEDSISFLYIRFFNTTISPITGIVTWGYSPVFGFTSEFGKVEQDFIGNYMAIITNNFVIIPEPSTGHLLLLFIGLVWGLRAGMKRAERAPPGNGPR